MDRARDAIRNAMQSAGSERPRSPRSASTRRRSSTGSRSKATRARAPIIHVTADPRGGWRAEKRGASRAIARSDSKREVVQRAREVAKSQEGTLIVHLQDGRIQEERTYGADSLRKAG
jgi:hypothetical protein